MKERHNNEKEELENKINNIIDKNISLEKEINSLKNNHNNEKDELEKIIKNISDKNINLEKDISLMKVKNNNKKEELQKKMNNISDVIEQIQQKLNELNNTKEKTNFMENKINGSEPLTQNQNVSNEEDEPNLNYLKSLPNIDTQKDYLGEYLFKKIERHPITQSKNLSLEMICKITGLILGIEDINEIYEITINKDSITARIDEALGLLESQ